MKIIGHAQGSPEWAAHRAQHFNASDAPAMLGCSPYKSRAQLLAEQATGVAPEVGEATQRLYDDGHRYEAMARPLAEAIINEDLYPVTGVSGRLSASFDGLTLMNDIAFEHKSLNDDLRAAMPSDGVNDNAAGARLPLHYRVQMEQQCLVSGAERVLFMASKWDGDKLTDQRHCWYTPDPALRARIVAGWAQFEADLAAWVPPVEDVKPVAATIEALPALVVNVEGRVVTSNFEPFKTAALTFLDRIKTDLQTDDDFATAERTVKFCKDGEDRLELVKQQALAQTASIDALFRAIDGITESMRAKRLQLDKLVKTRKESIRVEIVAEAQKALDAHRAALNARLGANWVPTIAAGFAESMKGMKTVASCREKVGVALMNAKIDASALADRLEINRKALVSEDGKDWFFLFADFSDVGNAPVEHFPAIAGARIQKHKDAEAAAKRAREDEETRRAAAQAAVAAPAVEVPRPVDVTIASAVVPLRAPVKPAAAEAPTLKLGAVCERLGFTMTRAFVESTLGIKPRATDKAAVLWFESDMARICSALSRHAQAVAQGEGVAA